MRTKRSTRDLVRGAAALRGDEAAGGSIRRAYMCRAAPLWDRRRRWSGCAGSASLSVECPSSWCRGVPAAAPIKRPGWAGCVSTATTFAGTFMKSHKSICTPSGNSSALATTSRIHSSSINRRFSNAFRDIRIRKLVNEPSFGNRE